MAERAKYEQWLADLEAKKDSTPVNVFDRVRQDYLTRLQSVMEQLKQHTVALQEHAGNLMARLRELEAAEQKLQEEQAEAELRSEVGEISTAEQEGATRKAERALTKLQEDHELVATDLNRIAEILGGEGQDGATAGDSTADAPRRSTDFDELAFLKSVVGSATPQSSTPPRVSKAGGAAEPPPAEKAKVKAEAPPAEKPKVPATSEGPLGIRTSGAVEQPKTLKCAECGSMNYPSEWYCERCGAELTVI
jgi:vacuolar-type H+-ATPase subunit I/STV1